MPMVNTSRTLREQLAPLNATLRESRAYVQPVSQVTLRLKPSDGSDRFHDTVRDILRWLSNRAGQKLPDEAWSLKSFEITDVGAQRAVAVGLSDPVYWAARLDDSDKQVARRTWVTEIGVGLEENRDVLFGARLICVSRGDNPSFSPTVPGFVKSVLASGQCELDGEISDGQPHRVNSETDVDWLMALLEKSNRVSDVIVLSEQEEDGCPPHTVLNAKALAQRLHGVAHVVVLSASASFALTDRVGKELSVFRQAVRTYRPGFRPWLDEPARHPLATSARMLGWENGGVSGFEATLCARAITNTVYVPGREDRLPSFNTVRQAAARLERAAAQLGGASEAELLRLYEEENLRLTSDLQEQKELAEQILEEAERERESAIERADEAVAQAMLARDRIRRLEERLTTVTGQSPETPIPDDLSGLEDWCKEHLVGSVIISNRAFQGAKKSVFHDPSMIYRVLLLLRDRYVPMRIHGGAEYKSAYLQALGDLHIEESLTGEGARFEGDVYTVQYQGRRRDLDRHLKGGNSRDPRYCFRLYFFWDDESQVVVVGWLPSHLENRLS